MKTAITKFNDVGSCDINVATAVKLFQNAGVKKGTSRLCRDSFILKSSGKYQLVNMKNSVTNVKCEIRKNQANAIIDKKVLIGRNSGFFRKATTYRTKASWDLIDRIS